MLRWEYRVISLADGRYTTALNEYGQDGWELVSVVENPPKPASASGSSMPGTLGRLEDATSKLTSLGESEAPSTLLWVLRRPLDDE
jgi:Domain of unknown function (DUF4177)